MRCVSVPDSESLKFEIVTEYLQIRERVIAKLGTGTGHWAQVESSRVTAGRDLRSSDWIWRSDVHRMRLSTNYFELWCGGRPPVFGY